MPLVLENQIISQALNQINWQLFGFLWGAQVEYLVNTMTSMYIKSILRHCDIVIEEIRKRTMAVKTCVLKSKETLK